VLAPAAGQGVPAAMADPLFRELEGLFFPELGAKAVSFRGSRGGRGPVQSVVPQPPARGVGGQWPARPLRSRSSVYRQ